MMPQHTIVLAHGILGFGALPGVSLLINYFNGVAKHLSNQGHTVHSPSVSTVGSVARRGKQLGDEILALPLSAGEKVHVIAHSMGGLDARHALANVPGVVDRVQTLVTIGTPHQGSPVADAFDHPTHPLFDALPAFLVELFRSSGGAVHDLTTDAARDFNEKTNDPKSVRYIEVAGNAEEAPHQLLLFRLAAAIGRFTNGEINDGVVTKSSALRDLPDHVHLPDWPVDHAGEIGWSLKPELLFNLALPFPPPADHLARYDAIVQML
jgi:triacylglycerol lipase